MTEAWQDIGSIGKSTLLLIADHASNHVPHDIELGVSQTLLSQHIAWDIGVAPLAIELCARLACPGILGGVSRLVIDFNREEDAPNLVPIESDGHAIPGNVIGEAEKARRIERFWRPYHQHVALQIAKHRPQLLVSLHSFTPQLATAPLEERPWDIGILYNQDDRAARIAIAALTLAGVRVGDQQPYSGKHLNATMNLHGEANDIAYLGIEMRQDQIGDTEGVQRWARILAPVIENCSTSLLSGVGGADAHA